MARKAEPPTLTNKQLAVLKEVAASRTSRNDHIQRAKIILFSAQGFSDRKTARNLNINRMTAATWRRRWLSDADRLSALDIEESGIQYHRSVLKTLSDEPRPGAPGKFTSEQICQIINVACETPEMAGLPLSHWSLSSLAEELVKRKIVDSISTSQLHIFLKSSRTKATQSKRMDPHANRR